MYNFLWTCFLVIPYFWVGVLTSKSSRFSKVSTDGNASFLATYQPVRSALQCAAICDRHRPPICQAYTFDQTLQKCTTFKNEIRMTRTPGNEVYRKRPYCDTADGFDEEKNGGQLFCYLLNGERKTASAAVEHCASLGAYLIHFEFVTETLVALFYVTRTKHETSWLWAGANDKDEEGRWVTNIDGAPLNTNVWNWLQGEPNGNSFENCIQFVPNKLSFLDNTCDKKFPYICERNVIK